MVFNSFASHTCRHKQLSGCSSHADPKSAVEFDPALAHSMLPMQDVPTRFLEMAGQGIPGSAAGG